MKVDKLVLDLMIATFSYCMGEKDCKMVSCTENEVTLKLEDNTEITLYAEAA
jgi:hypothetical protein